LGIQLPEVPTITLADADGGTELLTVQDGLPCLLARSRKRFEPPRLCRWRHKKSSPPNERAFGNPNFAPRRQLRRLRHSVFGIGRRFLEVAGHSSKPA
jgi:hypothetical protein